MPKKRTKEKSKSMVDIIKSKVKNSGGSMKRMFYVSDGQKKRVRFLSDAEDAIQILFHDKWGELNTPCLEYYGKNCPYCDRSDVRSRDNFAWSVYNYDTKEVEVLMYKANDSTPVPALLAMYEAYGTLLDRDYIISRTGEKLETSYSVVPLDKKGFVKKVKALTETQVFEILQKAFDVELDDSEVDDEGWSDDEDDEEEEVTPKKKKKAAAAPAKKKKKKPEPEDDDEDDEEDFDEDEEDDEVPWDEDEEEDDDDDEDEDEDDDDDDDDWEDEDEEEEVKPKKKAKPGKAAAKPARSKPQPKPTTKKKKKR